MQKAYRPKITLRPRKLEGEFADQISGPQVLNSGNASGGKFIGAINHGHYLKFVDVPLKDASRVLLRVAAAGAGGSIELRSGSQDGKLLGAATIEVNGQWEQFYDKWIELPAERERCDLYIVFVHPQRASGLMNLDSITFEKSE